LDTPAEGEDAVGDGIELIQTPAGDPAWRITKHSMVKDLLADIRLGVTHPNPAAASWYSKVDLAGRPMGRSGAEYEEHTWWRRAMNKVFSPQSLEDKAPRIQEIADELTDELSGQAPPADLRESFSVPLCSRIICELLGVPYEQIDILRHWSEEGAYAADIERSMAGIRAQMTYVVRLVRERSGTPGDDLVSELLALNIRKAKLYEGRVVKLVSGMLGFGRETPASSIDLAVVLLLTHPDQRELLRHDPSLLPDAIEEVLRLFRPPAASQGGLLRYAHTDIDLGDETIRAGDMVVLDIVAANRDPAVFSEPERFDITRRPNPHLGFGHGFYMCNFSRLARVELEIGLATLFDRFPALRLAEPPENLTVKTHLRTGGLAKLPVEW
jgi:cytochrome P450